MAEAPLIPPSIEHLVHEARLWRNETETGAAVERTGAIEVVARNMTAHIPDVDPHVIGTVMLRLASLLANDATDGVPAVLLVNLIGTAGADLITRKDPDQ